MNQDIIAFKNNFIANEESFTKINEYKLNFQKEIGFAIQNLQKNKTLLAAAKKNPVSMQNAISNIAAIGLTLNPADKLAYLIPRNGEVCLDLSYMGLIRVSVDSGTIKLVQAKTIRQNDIFEYTSIDEKPIHKFDAKASDLERGEIVSVYCVAKTVDNEYLTEVMNLDDIKKVRSKSMSFKYGDGPWLDHFEEMAKKSVIRKASKLWPRSERLNLATSLLDNVDGYDSMGNAMCSTQQEEDILDLCSLIHDGESRLARYVKSAFGQDTLDLISLTEKQATICQKTMQAVYDKEMLS